MGNDSVSCSPQEQQYESVVYTAVVTSVLVLLWLLGCVTNGLVLTVVLFRPVLRTTTNILLANVALIGLLFFLCVVSISAWVAANGGYWHAAFLCQVNGFCSVAFIAATWLSHAVVNIETFVRIRSPLRNRFTVNIVAMSILGIWGISTSLAVLALFTSHGYFIADARFMCRPDYVEYTSPFMSLYSSVLLISLGAMLFSQFGVYFIYRKIQHSSRVRARQSGVFTELTHQDQGEDRNESQNITHSVHFDTQRSNRVQSCSGDRPATKEELKKALAIFQSSLLFITLFILNTVTAILIDNYYPTDPTECSSEGSASFYSGTVHSLLFVLVLSISPLIYIRGNIPLKKAVKRAVLKAVCIKRGLCHEET